ncbi:Transmembrane protein 229B [Liparis tanakae]|uniref:Transmembrane protein 229B n=1 Tax=Liparis tanakae TaxID=230148 RepID=A0A4Z2HKY9_9TELE|nr:Transmembrane protein 229B [Liparis tanakae]
MQGGDGVPAEQPGTRPHLTPLVPTDTSLSATLGQRSRAEGRAADVTAELSYRKQPGHRAGDGGNNEDYNMAEQLCNVCRVNIRRDGGSFVDEISTYRQKRSAPRKSQCCFIGDLLRRYDGLQAQLLSAHSVNKTLCRSGVRVGGGGDFRSRKQRPSFGTWIALLLLRSPLGADATLLQARLYCWAPLEGRGASSSDQPSVERPRYGLASDSTSSDQEPISMSVTLDRFTTLTMRKPSGTRYYTKGDAGGGFCPKRQSLAKRLYVYALHGCLCEVAFTASVDWCSTRDMRLTGHSSLWALPMYAIAIYLIEVLRARLLVRRHPLPVRLVAYTMFIYLWEFSWGAGLSLLGACPWDYSGYRYNLAGLVTLEYAVPWTLAAFIAEQHVIENTLRIRLHN